MSYLSISRKNQGVFDQVSLKAHACSRVLGLVRSSNIAILARILVASFVCL